LDTDAPPVLTDAQKADESRRKLVDYDDF